MANQMASTPIHGRPRPKFNRALKKKVIRLDPYATDLYLLVRYVVQEILSSVDDPIFHRIYNILHSIGYP
jgi:hypothetical protein